MSPEQGFNKELAALRGQCFERDILDSVDANIAVLNRQGVIIAVNRHWQRYTEENAPEKGRPVRNTDIGTNYLEVCRRSSLAGSEYARAALEGIEAVIAGHAADFQYEYPCHSPTELRWFKVSVSPMLSHPGGVVVLHTEITDRKLAELAQAASAERLSATLNATKDGILAVANNGEVLFMNRQFRMMWNLSDDLMQSGSDEQLMAHALTQLLDPQPFMKQVQALYQSTDESDDLVELIDGRVFERHSKPLYENGQTKGRVWSFHDITERQRAEQDLIIFRRIFEASEQGIGVTDAEGYLLYSNVTHDRLLGYEPSECLGMHFTEFFPEETMQWAPETIMSAAVRGESWHGLLPVKRKDGSELITASNLGSTHSSDGRLQYLFNILSDYTSEFQRQQQLANAKEEADRANEAKSAFLSSMSHELRTPMNAILGFSQLLEDDDRLEADQKDDVREILKAGSHLLDLINEVLDLSRVESGQLDLSLETVEVSAVAGECLAMIEPLAQRRNIVIQNSGLKPAWVRADRTRLKQVLLNLLSNAVKYNREGGQVGLNIKVHEHNRLRIQVSDTGKGLSLEQTNNLFQPFDRLGAEYGDIEGTGIGLTIVSRLMQLMRGSVDVESEEGVGSTFWLELPLDEVVN